MLAVFLDLETTGLDPTQHRIIDLAYEIIDLTNRCKLAKYTTVIHQPYTIWQKNDPASIQVNGFTWEMLQQGKTEEEVRAEVISQFDAFHINRSTAFFICQNPAFDRSFFYQLASVSLQEKKQWPYHWLDLASMYFALNWKELQNGGMQQTDSSPLSKNSIATAYNLPTEPLPHRAANGVSHLIACFERLMQIEFSNTQHARELS